LGFLSLRHGQDRVDHRLDAARGERVPQQPLQASEYLGFHLRRAAPESTADESDAPSEQQVGVYLRLRATERGDHDPATADGHLLQAAAELRAPNAVHRDVHGMLGHGGHEVIGATDDDDVGSEASHKLRLLPGANRGHHRCTERLGKLDRGHPEATRSGLDQDRVPRLHAALDAEVQVGCGESLRYRGGLHHGQPLGNRQGHRGRHGHLLRVATSTQKRADAVTDRESALLGGIDDHARHLKAHPLGPARRRWVVAGPLHEVGTVQRGRMDVDHDLIGLRGGVSDLTP